MAINDDILTVQLAEVIMGWRTSPNRFHKSGRSWIPRWRFQPLKNLKDALELLEKASPQHFTLQGNDKTGFHTKVCIAGAIGEARGKSEPRTIAYAVARALGVKVPFTIYERTDAV
jgi:hypothetical protein